MPTAHRLTLTAAEFALLVAESGVHLPPGFVVPEPVPATTPEPAVGADGWLTESAAGAGGWLTESATAEVGLRRRGLLDGDGTPVSAVEANLAVLGGPQLSIRTVLVLDGRHHRALHTLSGGLAAALLMPPGAEVELALFPAWELSAELSRAIPGLKRETDVALTGALPFAALAHATALASRTRDAPASGAGGEVGEFGSGSEASGEVAESGLVAGAEFEVAGFGAGLGSAGVAVEGLTNGEAALLRLLARRMCGALRSVVTSGDGVVVGQILWLATDAGWLGLRPGPEPAGHGVVSLEQVKAADFGSWLAPILQTGLDTGR